MTEEDPVLRITEASELLRISEKTLRRRMKEPGFPVIQVGNSHPRFLRSELVRWMREESRKGRSA